MADTYFNPRAPYSSTPSNALKALLQGAMATQEDAPTLPAMTGETDETPAEIVNLLRQMQETIASLLAVVQEIKDLATPEEE